MGEGLCSTCAVDSIFARQVSLRLLRRIAAPQPRLKFAVMRRVGCFCGFGLVLFVSQLDHGAPIQADITGDIEAGPIQQFTKGAGG